MIYIEEECMGHPVALQIQDRFPKASKTPCQRYGEIFNRKAQNFRLQKQSPSLILAKKQGSFLLPTPPSYSIGGSHNFYFSHMLNCIFDCRYCFLQGHLRSAHYVFFVNFAEVEKEIEKKLLEIPSEPLYFFSGYDCDSLALESITHFLDSSLPFFQKEPRAILEVRTKSTYIASLLKTSPIPNCIIAFSLSPHEIQQSLEHKTPSLQNRLQAIKTLQEKGWKIGLRFDPVIYCDSFEEVYCRFFAEVFSSVALSSLHSITLGAFRLPRETYKNMLRLYPEEKLFCHSLKDRQGLVTYEDNKAYCLLEHCKQQIMRYAPQIPLFTYEDLS